MRTRLMTTIALMALLAAMSAAARVSAAEEAGVTAVAEKTGVITFISSLPRTGSSKGQSDSMVNGIHMAIDEVDGMILGYKIDYQDLDDASPERGSWDPAVEQSNATKAIQNPDVMVYLGTYNSGAAKVIAADLNKAGLAMISPANTAIGLTKANRGGEPDEPAKYRPSGQITYFRVVPADDIQGMQGAQWAYDLGAKNVYILHDRELYGEGLAKVFREHSKFLGMTIAGYEGINPKEANYRALVLKIINAKADLVYFGGTTQTNAGQLAKDLVAGGSDAKLMVPDGCYETSFIESAGAENINGRCYITFGGLPPDQLTGKGADFVKAYTDRYGMMPEAYAIYAYEAAKVAIDALRRAGVKDRAKMLEALRSTTNFQGALGTWSFDANGDTTLTLLSGNTVTDGAFEFVKLLGGEAGAAQPTATPPTGSAPAEAPATSNEKPAAKPIGLLVVAGVVIVIVVILVLKKPKE